MTAQDDELKQHFAAQRDDDARVAPRYHATRAAAVARRGARSQTWPRPRVAAAAAVAVVAVAGYLVWPRGDAGLAAGGLIDPAATEWRAPTDFLLETPGAELLRALPHIESGVALDLGPEARRNPS